VSAIDLAAVARVLGGTKAKKTTNGYDVPCPCHDDRTASLSIAIGDNGEPVVHCHAGCANVWEVVRPKIAHLLPAKANGQTGGPRRIVASYDYLDSAGELVFQVVRYSPKDFRQRRPDGSGGWIWNLDKVRPLVFHLPEITEAIALGKTIVIVEGEKDVLNLAKLGIVATCNAMGAANLKAKTPKWKREHALYLAGADVVILPDNDEAGRRHAKAVASSLKNIARRIRVLELPDLPPKGDVTDWLAAGHTAEELWELAEAAPEWAPEDRKHVSASGALAVDSFVAYLPDHKYIDLSTGDLWPPSSVNEAIESPARREKTSAWLDRNRPVHCISWLPGEARLIENTVVTKDGRESIPGRHTFNRYKAPVVRLGNAAGAKRWLWFIDSRYGEDARHQLVARFAHRVQRPAEKINHGVVLGGPPGIGKDCILAPVVSAIGRANCAEAAPHELTGSFTAFLQAVMLRINEARDLGEVSRYAFYESTKVLLASPPDVLAVNEKFLPRFNIPNVVFVVFTTNHRDALYLPADDRRHYVLWSEVPESPQAEAEAQAMYEWYARGGNADVAAMLHAYDLTAFNPHATPPKTAAFWAMVEADRTPANSAIADVLEELHYPRALTVARLRRRGDKPLQDWLDDPRNHRSIPRLLADHGYVAVGNPDDKRRRWKLTSGIYTWRGVVYVLREVPENQRVATVAAYPHEELL
jgi:5S rRNA maturation endonuclease (ribonuclease M5)